MKVAHGKQRHTCEYSSKRKLMNTCIELSLGSMLVVVWGFRGSWACFWWFHVHQGWPGSILGAFWEWNRCPEGGFWGSRAQFRLHFACLLRVLRLPGTLLGAFCAPGVAWMHFGIDFESQNGAKKEPKCIQKSMQKSMKFGVRFYMEIRPQNGAKMEARTLHKSMKNALKIQSEIYSYF